MANVLKHEKQEQIRSLGRLGWSLRRIEEATGVRRETVSRYLRAAGITVRGHRMRRLKPNPRAATQVTSDLERSSLGSRSPGSSACEPYHETIVTALALGRNATAIWQDLVSEHGFDSSYENVKRFCRRLSG